MKKHNEATVITSTIVLPVLLFRKRIMDKIMGEDSTSGAGRTDP